MSYPDKYILEQLKDHVITTKVNTPWCRAFHCAKPGTSVYSFTVIFTPGSIHFYGDMYTLSLQPHNANSLAWLCGSIDSTSYVLEKCPHRSTLTEFSQEEVQRRMQEYRKEYEDDPEELVRIDEVIEAIEDRELNYNHEWYELWSDITDDCEPPTDGLVLREQTIMQLTALKWFTDQIAHGIPAEERL